MNVPRIPLVPAIIAIGILLIFVIFFSGGNRTLRSIAWLAIVVVGILALWTELRGNG